MEDSRSTSDTHAAQSGLSFEAAVGSFYSTADSIALPKRIGVFFSATAGKAALLGSVVQAITSAAFLDRAFINKLTLAAHRQRHNGFCLAGFSIVDRRDGFMAGRAANNFFRLLIDVKIIDV